MFGFGKKKPYEGPTQSTDPNAPGYVNPNSDGTYRPAGWCPDGLCTSAKRAPLTGQDAFNYYHRDEYPAAETQQEESDWRHRVHHTPQEVPQMTQQQQSELAARVRAGEQAKARRLKEEQKQREQVFERARKEAQRVEAAQRKMEAEAKAEAERQAWAAAEQAHKERHEQEIKQKVNRWTREAQEAADAKPEPVKVNKWKSL